MPKWDFEHDPGLAAPHFEGQELVLAAKAVARRRLQVTPEWIEKHWPSSSREILQEYFDLAQNALRAVFPGATFYEPPAPDKDIS